ncbi:MAG: anthranilate phosphoribosyltransferase [Deltaproteobacteria bacterium]|nr:anthranilate phosphoribosyltransferase [Deltaproteobacteria bacterium]
MFKKYLNQIIHGKNLNEAEMYAMIMEIFSGNITDAQIGAFMAALATKGETFEEVAGAAKAMRSKAYHLDITGVDVIDTCGTGGDGAKTFNISTTTAFVVAGCGLKVAKHGNRSVSSQCGSADLLEVLGVKIDADPAIAARAVSETGIGFFFAPLFHGAMKYVARARKEIGVRSIFNMIGPLTNPANANCQLIGVYALELTELMANALKLLGSKRAFVVHGYDGLDEVTICAPTRISELKDQKIKTYDVFPNEFFSTSCKPEDIMGGNPKKNAEITLEIFNGKSGPKRDIVILNASFALVAGGKAKNILDGIQIAGTSIDNGAALQKLDELVRFSQQ